jgi:hypothetical protein
MLREEARGVRSARAQRAAAMAAMGRRIAGIH